MKSTTGRQQTAREPEILLNALRGFNVAAPSLPGEETSAVRDRLRALGYVGGSPAAPRDGYTEADDPKRLIELDAMLHRAGDLYQQGKLEGAAQAFQQVIARRPDTADAYRYLAFVYWQGGRPADAIQTLEKALQNGITHRDVRVKLGVYLSETGNAARAIHLLEGLAGDDIEALNALGIAYGTARRSADAIRTFKHVLEVDPTNGLGWQNIGHGAAPRRRPCGRRSLAAPRAGHRRHAARRLHHARRRAVADRSSLRSNRDVETCRDLERNRIRCAL